MVYDRFLGITYDDANDQERAIDVPDSLIERKKTPPQYPDKVIDPRNGATAPPRYVHNNYTNKNK